MHKDVKVNKYALTTCRKPPVPPSENAVGQAKKATKAETAARPSCQNEDAATLCCSPSEPPEKQENTPRPAFFSSILFALPIVFFKFAAPNHLQN